MSPTPPARVVTVDLLAVARASADPGVAWAYGGADLNANLVAFDPGDGVAAHVNDEVDVLLVGLTGAGVVTVDGVAHPLSAGLAVVIPRGANRAIRAEGERLAYLSCHRARAPLQLRRARADSHGTAR
jgi:quercetin dioxygenase-like cupin family protein